MQTTRLPARWLQSGLLPLVVGFCSCALALLLAWVVIDISHTKARTEMAGRAQSHLLQIRDRLDRQLQSTLSVPETLAAFVAAQGHMSPEIFASVVGRLLESRLNIRNLALAPDNVISDVYPRLGNEKAIGLRYLDNPQQRGAVERAIQTRRTVVAGPIPLVQGGLGIVSRTPVFLSRVPGTPAVTEPRYWGIVSLAVNADTLFADVGLNTDQMGFQVAARGLDAMGAQGAVFVGRASLFDEKPVTLDVPLPGGGSWILAAVPVGGWGAAGRAPGLVVMLSYVFALLLGLLSAWLVRAQQQLWDKNQELERVSATKSTFLATMSHEIRTPMNGILGMLELLQHTDMTARQLDYARKAQGAAQSLLGIINAILDISKVEAGKMALECAPFVLRDVLHALRAVLSASQGSKLVELRLDVAPDVPAVLLGDALRLRQVLLNLSGNALKFTARGEVVLSIALLGWQGRLARLEFSVLDTGIGIAPDKLALIFEGFNQADAATARHFGGTGLGLAISKQLVALMGGDLQVQSTPGVGSRFYFQVALEALTDEAGLGIDSQAVAPVHQSWQGTHRLHGLRLLVVDDNRLGQQVAQELLQNCGAQVAIASCGLAAVAQALAADPPLDAILMDLRMPDIDGLEATRRIRSHPHMQAVPIIAMTANAMAADRDACRAAGMADHVSKPIDLDALIRTVLRHARPTAGSGQPSAPLASAPREAPPAQRAVLDVEQAIERMCGDRALYVKVAAAFRVEAMEKLAGFERALAQGQRHDALRCLHTLAGLAGIVGANQLNHAAAQAEAALAASPQFVATGNAPEAADQLQALATQLRLAIWMLDQLQL